VRDGRLSPRRSRQAVRRDTEEFRQMWNLRHAARELAPVVRAFPVRPVQVVKALPDEWRKRMGKASVAEANFDDDWKEHLHTGRKGRL
jgi:hypothetical protein